jgi:hypothetical protein
MNVRTHVNQELNHSQMTIGSRQHQSCIIMTIVSGDLQGGPTHVIRRIDVLVNSLILAGANIDAQDGMGGAACVVNSDQEAGA